MLYMIHGKNPDPVNFYNGQYDTIMDDFVRELKEMYKPGEEGYRFTQIRIEIYGYYLCHGYYDTYIKEVKPKLDKEKEEQKKREEEEKKRQEEIAKKKNYTFNVNDWTPDSQTRITNGTLLVEEANKIIGVINIIASISSVIFLIIIGIKYMLGSVEEKAEYKKTMGAYALGAIMVFGITNILNFIVSIVQTISNG